MSTVEPTFASPENQSRSDSNISESRRAVNDARQLPPVLPDNLSPSDLATAFTELKSLISSLKEDIRLIATARMRLTMFMTTREAAKFYRVSPERILSLEDSGLPFYDGIGKGHRYLMEDLILFRRQHRSLFNRRKYLKGRLDRLESSAMEERIAAIIGDREPDRFEEES